MIILKSPREIERMRVACRMVAEILELLKSRVKPGITTSELEAFANDEARKRKAKPAFKGYCNYPSALCCSPNEQVVHGLPTVEPLKDGDILSLDFGILYDDFYGDAAVTLPVGAVDPAVTALLKATEESLYEGIAKALPDGRLFDISHAIQVYVERRGYSVVRDFVGHGIGRSLHEDPQVPNYGHAGKGVRLKPGMVLAIEPMINQYSYEVKTLDDGWTVVTNDGGLSAHFEHTVAITESGPDILTRLTSV
ncbi:type I methionyl aminopeptidase [Geobacter sp. SVR]|uniref:type I methionyl aminopeptidase n=1 Tax=Geobacter sp. SVR TaxID=2495594 RepID=UPI00143F0309|nr:type I methionyl aminopeptidase [Geobacter sp. SVR]BCS53079.1 methionine aminopeptidase [Geobacter sp. SVR]GCF84464.1 methionine aminopeptidase [Geobacter sp. SVR]